ISAEAARTADSVGVNTAEALSSADGLSSASMTESADGASTTTSIDPNTGYIIPAIVTNIAQGVSTQTNSSHVLGRNSMHGHSSANGRNATTTNSRSSS